MIDYKIENITQVNKEYIFIKLDDGKQLRIKTKLNILTELYPKVLRESKFYEKAMKELRIFADKQRDMLPHYYTEEELKVAGRWKRIDMELKNEYAKEKLHQSIGVSTASGYFHDLFDKYYTLVCQMDSVIKSMQS